ncbi:lipid II flippase MurJ [Comamonas sp. NoAH]|uniref:lipid II flippase MurJ n=1 Tax=Comamonas halotolerans TaxID=3041496 RepID=UPI0024E17592|nr:lipid II flippase MurJ [Comamonas sp. NoAH]
MGGKTLWLTLVTLAGLAAGFAREWLLVAAWGGGGQSDAFVLALFVPEAVRMTLAGGLLASAALPIFRALDAIGRRQWLSMLVPQMLLIALAMTAVLGVGASQWAALLGSGLSPEGRVQVAANLQWLAWCLPGFVIHALLAIPLQAHDRYVLAGLGSLLFNLPPTFYLAWSGAAASDENLAASCVLGSSLMWLPLLVATWTQGWRPWNISARPEALRELCARLWPLLGSNLASHGLALMERMIASLLGEGVLTWVNLARKLVNLPLVALMSLNQVLLGLMSAKQGGQRLAILQQGIAITSVLSLPAAVAMAGAAPALVYWLLPASSSTGPLPMLLTWFALPLVFGAWNAMLARYAYAGGDTRLPLRCELTGSLANALLLLALPFLYGAAGIALAAWGGAVLTGWLLMRQMRLRHALPWRQQWGLSLVMLALARLLLFPVPSPLLQLLLTSLCSAVLLAWLLFWLRPWKVVLPSASE